MREAGDAASDWKSYSNIVQEPLPVSQGNSGLQQRCVVTPVMLTGDIGIAYMECTYAIMLENDIGREEGRGTTVGAGLTFR